MHMIAPATPEHDALSPETAVVFAAEQLQALAESEEAAAQDVAARLGYWRHSDEAAAHLEAALLLRRHARELLAGGDSR
jgi:hypothetical protein